LCIDDSEKVKDTNAKINDDDLLDSGRHYHFGSGVNPED
jgi:hypothetical protein